jgi:hypothetical protein
LAVDTALVIAGLSGAVALGSAVMSWRTQLSVAERQALRDREIKDEERRSEAKIVLDRYRGPLLDAAWQLGDRIDSIRHGDFLQYFSAGHPRARDAKLTTLHRFAYYFGWREFMRTQVQLLRFADEQDTRLVAGLLDDVTWALSSSSVDGGKAMLWPDEQRGIGELMTEGGSGAGSPVLGHAAFHRTYEDVFAPWMERIGSELLTPAAASSERLRLVQWAMSGLTRRLDEEGTYAGNRWIDRTTAEVRSLATTEPRTHLDLRLRQHLAALDST